MRTFGPLPHQALGGLPTAFTGKRIPPLHVANGETGHFVFILCFNPIVTRYSNQPQIFVPAASSPVNGPLRR